jgi:hypothetical protein
MTGSDRRVDLGIPGWVGKQYYRHGLFCASHPRLVLMATILGVFWTCLPLLSLPIYTGEVKLFAQKLSNLSTNSSPNWLLDGQPPVAYVLQIVVKAMVQPYRKEEMIRTDAFRSPMATAFKLHLEDLLPFKDEAT